MQQYDTRHCIAASTVIALRVRESVHYGGQLVRRVVNLSRCDRLGVNYMAGNVKGARRGFKITRPAPPFTRTRPGQPNLGEKYSYFRSPYRASPTIHINALTNDTGPSGDLGIRCWLPSVQSRHTLNTMHSFQGPRLISQCSPFGVADLNNKTVPQ